MTTERIIPRTKIMNRYVSLRDSPQKERLRMAQYLIEHPEELAAEFTDSVDHFESYSNIGEDFYPADRPQRSPLPVVRTTNDLVLRLEINKRIAPVEGDDRGARMALSPKVVAVSASDMEFDYVDRELLIHRTTSPARWEDGTHNRGGLRLDAVLADAKSRIPIVGEVKLPGDMDPFFALIQALACTAHLATANQYERMRISLKRGIFPPLSTPARFDVFVLLVPEPGERNIQSKGKYMPGLTNAAEQLAQLLLTTAAINRHVRRFAGIAIRWQPEDFAVQPAVNWAWTAASSKGQS